MTDPIVQARDESVHGLRSAIRWLGATTVILTLGLGLSLYQDRLDARRNGDRISDNADRLADIERAEFAFKELSCVTSNINALRIRNALAGGLTAILNLSSSLSEDERAAILDTYQAEVIRASEYRDCSRAGIERYFDNPPQDPATQENPE